MNQRLLTIMFLLSLLLSACATGPAASEVPATPTRPAGEPTNTPSPIRPTPTPETDRVQGQAELVQSQLQRDTAPSVGPAEREELVAGNSAFALELYQALRDKKGNLFYSPYSISAALAMTYAGARTETEQQMADTLHFVLPQDRLHPAFNALDLALVTSDQEAFKLHIANSLWGQAGYDFLPDFLDTLAQNYGAGLRLLDFANESEPARQTINEWISEQTAGRIKDLIPPGAVTALTRLVLANAIYFDADWVYPFDAEHTRDGTFNTLEDGPVTVPMMELQDPTMLSYTRGDGYQAVELPYQGDQTSMVILVPDAGQFEAFEAALEAALVEAILDDLESKRVALTMPKFSYESEFDLGQTLAGMGMPDAFAGGVADFAGMDGTRDLLITGVFHKAFVAVDEAGTEAAAATAVVVGVTSAPPLPDVTLTIDRPFVFMIRDVESGTLLFVGRVVNPAG